MRVCVWERECVCTSSKRERDRERKKNTRSINQFVQNLPHTFIDRLPLSSSLPESACVRVHVRVGAWVRVRLNYREIRCRTLDWWPKICPIAPEYCFYIASADPDAASAILRKQTSARNKTLPAIEHERSQKLQFHFFGNPEINWPNFCWGDRTQK